MALITDPMALVAVCSMVCALVFWSTEQSWSQPFFKVVPSVVLVYYLPTLGSTIGLIPSSSSAYEWMRDYILPFSLFVLMVTADVPSVFKVGKKAILMMLVGTLGIVLGGPIAFVLFKSMLAPDSWKALAALSGSWIGGGGNFAAIKESVGASDELIGPIIIVDTAVGYTWTGVLLILANYQRKIDRWNQADSQILQDLNSRLKDFKESTARSLELSDVAVTVSVGFTGAILCKSLGQFLFDSTSVFLMNRFPNLAAVFSPFTWMVILITTFGILLSLTPLRRIEYGGASKLGYLALYLFLASLGAKANLAGLLEAPVLLVVGVVWILIHVLILLIGARLLRAPFFLVAVGSQANIGGAATAPIVAAAYYGSLAPVGLLMGIFGYLIGNYAGLLCAFLLRLTS